MHDEDFPPKTMDLLANDEEVWIREEPQLIFPQIVPSNASGARMIKANNAFIYLGEHKLTADSHALWFENCVVSCGWATLWNKFRLVSRVD